MGRAARPSRASISTNVEDLVPGIEQGLQHGVEGGPGAHGHEDVIGRVGEPRGRAEPPRHRIANARVAGVGHVGVQVGRLALEHAPRGGQHGWRRLDLGIAQGEVEDLVSAALLLEASPLLEHAADPRRLRQILGDGAGDDHGGSIGPPGRGLGDPVRGFTGGWYDRASRGAPYDTRSS
jgi:hypothetical protein